MFVTATFRNIRMIHATSRAIAAGVILSVGIQLAADELSDEDRVCELLRERNVLIVAGAEEQSRLKRDTWVLANKSGQPVVEDHQFISDGDRKWAFAGCNAGRLMLAVGTTESNTLISELFYTDKKTRPEPIWTGEKPAATVRFFEEGELPQEPWLGQEFAVITGSDEKQVVALLRKVSRRLDYRQLPELSAWFESIMNTTFPMETNVAGEGQSLELSGARRERLWAKLVVRTQRSVPSLRVRISAFTGATALQPLTLYHLARRDAFADGFNVIDDVMVPMDSDPDGGYTFNDPVARRAECFMLEYQVPEGASAGSYAAEITIEAGEHDTALPVTLDVYDFAVPETMPVKVYFYGAANKYGFWEFFNCKNEQDYRKALHSLGRQFRKFGANVCPRIDYTGMVKWIVPGAGDYMPNEDEAVRFDYSPMEEFIEIMNEEGLGPPYVIGVRADRPRDGQAFRCWGRAEVYDTAGQHYDKRLHEWRPGPCLSLPQEHRFKRVDWLRYLHDHLRKSGRLEDTYFYGPDEPGDFEKFNAAVKPFLDAGLKPTSSINKYSPVEDLQKLIDSVKLWVFLYHPWQDERWDNKPRHDLWQPFAEERRAAGEPVWWYNCWGMLARHRLPVKALKFGWRSWKYNVDGAAFWSPFSFVTVCNKVNGGQDLPVIPVSKIPWSKFTNSAMAFYNDTENHELLGSRRMTRLGRAWEDYKYLWTLEQKIGWLPAGSDIRPDAEAALNDAYEIANSAGTPDDVDPARRMLAEMIVRLNQAGGN